MSSVWQRVKSVARWTESEYRAVWGDEKSNGSRLVVVAWPPEQWLTATVEFHSERVWVWRLVRGAGHAQAVLVSSSATTEAGARAAVMRQVKKLRRKQWSQRLPGARALLKPGETIQHDPLTRRAS